MYLIKKFAAPQTKLIIDARLAYKNKGDSENNWKHYASSIIEKNLDCEVENVSS